jgi:tRNA (guanine6-N2)-methyltransferase
VVARGAQNQRMRPPAGRRPEQQHGLRPDGLKQSQIIELVFLPGLADLVVAEAAELSPRGWRDVPGRDDAVVGEVRGSLGRLRTLRTVVSAFLVLSFPVPRPKSLLSGEFFPQIVDAVREIVRLNRVDPPRSVRIEAAGRDSAVMRTLARQVAQAAGLREDEENGDLVVRVRPTPGRDGWDVLIRLSTRPLSARAWRVAGYPAAANATMAAAMVALSEPRPADRVVDLMSGSGTILIERLLAAKSAGALGVDLDAEAVAAAQINLTTSGQAEHARLLVGDIGDDDWLADGPFDVLFADPPWGDKSGDHAVAEQVHEELLDRAYRGAAKRARLVLLTHEIRIMERLLQQHEQQWRLRSQTRVFHKGHHPRIYLLDRR